MGWWLLGLGLVLLAAFVALQFAIQRNGPAVLDNVDRITGGTRGLEQLEKVRLGEAAEQKLAVYGEGAGLAAPKPVIVFMHGGSWSSGNPDDYGFVARGLVPEGFVVVLGGYRLGAPGKFPAMLEDTAAVVAWTRNHIARHGGDPDAIFIAGHSAGAYNAAMVALDRQWLGREGLPDDTIKGVIGLAGPYDFYPFDSESTRASFGDADDPVLTQPINFVRSDAPPMLLLTGMQDTTVKPRNSRVLAEKLRKAGVRIEADYYPGMDHTGILTALASPWRRDPKVIQAIAGFVRNTDPSTPVSVPVQAEAR